MCWVGVQAQEKTPTYQEGVVPPCTQQSFLWSSVCLPGVRAQFGKGLAQAEGDHAKGMGFSGDQWAPHAHRLPQVVGAANTPNDSIAPMHMPLNVCRWMLTFAP